MRAVLGCLCLLAFPALTGGELVAEANSSARPALTAQDLIGLSTDVATLILRGSDGGELAAQVLALPLLTSVDKAAVGLWVECDIETLLSENASGLSLEIYAYAIGAGGAVRAHLSQRIELTKKDIDPDTVEAGLRFVGHLDPVEPGDYKLRVLIREPASQRFALRTIELVVPTQTAGTSFLSPPVVVDSVGSESSKRTWLNVYESPRGSVTPQAQARRLWALDGPPAALPVMYSGRDAELVLLIQHLPAGAEEIGLTLSSTDGDTFELPAVRPERSAIEPRRIGPQRVELEAVERLTLRVSLPIAPQGLYVLHTTLETPEGTAIKAPARTVFIADDDPLRVRQGLAGPAQPAHRSLNLGEVRKKRRMGLITEAYRQILSDLAAGLWEKALVDLHHLETSSVRELEDAPMTLLDEAEKVVFSRVQQHQPEALIPILALHLRLHRVFVEERENALRAHAERMASLLAERYAAEVETDLARSLAADALAILGRDLQEARLPSPALKCLERSLELDPRNRFALLSLAVGREEFGRYTETVEALERLVAIDGGSGEAKLRLAINLYRAGRVREATGRFQELINVETSDWILSLAHQELARAHLDAGRYQAATHVLDQAIRRLGDDGSLLVQRAYALDRSERSEAGTTIVFPSQKNLRAGGTSPRSRYQASASRDQDQARASLLRSSTARLAALAEAILE